MFDLFPVFFHLRLSAFLFRPFPIIDRGSLFLTAAGIENIVWLLMFLSIVIFLFRLNLRSHSIFPILSILLFIIFFSIATALYEGNLGTAFRHKSTIQSPLILLILLLLVSQKEKSGVRRL